MHKKMRKKVKKMSSKETETLCFSGLDAQGAIDLPRSMDDGFCGTCLRASRTSKGPSQRFTEAHETNKMCLGGRVS